MARRGRSRKRSRSRGRRSRISKGRILLILGVVVALAYFAFTKLLYDPFEESQRPFEQLAPRNVDVYIRREGLANDFTTGGSLPSE